MEPKDFIAARRRLGKTQKEMAQLLGISLKAVSSYEQGWRTIPSYVERQLLFLLMKTQQGNQVSQNCWDLKDCPTAKRKTCPAYEFHSGEICWFVSGTLCSGHDKKSWQDKLAYCRACVVLKDST